jgi:hypothetical protein
MSGLSSPRRVFDMFDSVIYLEDNSLIFEKKKVPSLVRVPLGYGSIPESIELENIDDTLNVHRYL